MLSELLIQVRFASFPNGKTVDFDIVISWLKPIGFRGIK